MPKQIMLVIQKFDSDKLYLINMEKIELQRKHRIGISMKNNRKSSFSNQHRCF